MAFPSMVERQAARARTVDRCRPSIIPTLVALNGFALGGFAALMAATGLLSHQLQVYAPNNMAASVILDVMDDLAPYYTACAVLLTALVMLTGSAWAWLTLKSRRLRMAVIAFCVAVMLATSGAWLLRGAAGPSVPERTPTSAPQVVDNPATRDL